MEIMIQIGIVFGVCLLGQFISSNLPIAVPASVIGLVLLLLLLCLKIIKPSHIEKKSNFLLKNMAFFFIPAGVSILDKYSFVKGNILSLLLVCLITTILTFGATAWTVTLVIKLQEKLREKENG